MSYVYALVRRAITKGLIVRPVCCEACGMIRATFAHHDDYLKTLEVRWLCKPCHGQWHSENGPGLHAELADLLPTRTHNPKAPGMPTSVPRIDRATRDARNAEMKALLTQGWTLQQIGDKYQITRERVRQITGSPRLCRPTLGQLKQRKAADCLGEINDLRREGKSFTEIAEALQLQLTAVKSVPWVEPRAIKHGTMNAYNRHKCRCSLCRKKATGIQTQIAKNLHAKGLCTRCRKPVGGKQWMCEPCRARHTQMYNTGNGPKISRSGVKGVTWNEHSKHWRVIRYVDGKQVHHGAFQNLEDAKALNSNIPFPDKRLRVYRKRAA